MPTPTVVVDAPPLCRVCVEPLLPGQPTLVLFGDAEHWTIHLDECPGLLATEVVRELRAKLRDERRKAAR